MGDFWGGGIVIAAAAALWLAYLVPSWLRRREYLATERNAVRLQQTLRILAETAEVPEEVRVEATAREVAAQQRVLRKTRAASEARARRAATLAVAEARRNAVAEATASGETRNDEKDGGPGARPAPVEETRTMGEDTTETVHEQASTGAPGRTPGAARPGAGRVRVERAASRRRRRIRALSSLVLLAALVGVVVGAVLAAVAASWAVLIVSGLAFVAAGCSLVAVAPGRRATTRESAGGAVAAAAPRSTRLYDDAEHDAPAPEAAAPERVSWTPQTLPRPLHLAEGSIAAGVVATADEGTLRRRAAERAALERRTVTREQERAAAARRTELRRAEAQRAERGRDAAAPAAGRRPDAGDRFAGMGVVEEQDGAALDLDAVLRRRRAG